MSKKKPKVKSFEFKTPTLTLICAKGKRFDWDYGISAASFTNELSSFLGDDNVTSSFSSEWLKKNIRCSIKCNQEK